MDITTFFKHIYLLALLFLVGCASSAVSRQAAAGFDPSIHPGPSEFSPGMAYQNSSQMTKGVIMGGAAGAVTSSVTGLGFLPGLAGGAILGGAIGAYIDANTTLVDRLENRNVAVIVLGDQVMIVIPSDQLFIGMTGQLRPSAFSTLDLVVALIGNFINMSVHVAAYTNNSGSCRVDMAVSKEQANSVAKYLWARCVNTRLLVANGYGSTHLVVPNCPTKIHNDNYRVEITLEKLPV